jgi:hypothetical protein
VASITTTGAVSFGLNEIVFSQEAKINPSIAITNPMRFLISMQIQFK